MITEEHMTEKEYRAHPNLNECKGRKILCH